MSSDLAILDQQHAELLDTALTAITPDMLGELSDLIGGELLTLTGRRLSDADARRFLTLMLARLGLICVVMRGCEDTVQEA